MEIVDLRKKWMHSIGKVDDRFLQMIDALYMSYTSDKSDFFDDLPNEIKTLLLESLKQTKQGNVFSHEEVMAEFRKKYNIAG